MGKLRVSFLGKQQQKLPPHHDFSIWALWAFDDCQSFRYTEKTTHVSSQNAAFWKSTTVLGVPVPLLTRAVPRNHHVCVDDHEVGGPDEVRVSQNTCVGMSIFWWTYLQVGQLRLKRGKPTTAQR